MLFRFPPLALQPADPTFLTGKSGAFAKLKIESKAGQRTVFLTEHTLLFVLTGVKLLHFGNQSLRVAPDHMVLLRKGIYVMAEYIEEGLHFEALLLFIPTKLLRLLAVDQAPTHQAAAQTGSYVVFPVNVLTQGFAHQLRQYFTQSLQGLDQLLWVKQQEILLLLMASGHRSQLVQFMRTAISTDPNELDFIVRTYLFQPITLQELASLANRSLASFKRDFQRYYQCAPRQWINRQRLTHARLLVQNTDQRIADIAGVCGFDSLSYFSRLFKKEYGCTPMALRAKWTTE